MVGNESTTFGTPAREPAGLDQVGDCAGGTVAIRSGGSGDVGEVDGPKVETEDVLSAGRGRLVFALRSGTRETDTTTLPRSLAATTSRPPTRGVGVGSGSPSQLVPRFGEAEIESERANDC